MLHVKFEGLSKADRALRRFSAQVDDLRPFWRSLGETLADDAQSRWPLKRRTGRLRKSLVWAGSRLGRGGVFESSPDLLHIRDERVLFAICSNRHQETAGHSAYSQSIERRTASS